MKQATPSAVRVSRWALPAAVLCCLLLPAQRVWAQSAPAAASGFSSLQGFVIDSIHSAPLTKGVVVVEGTDRSAVTDASGHYKLDSIPPGKHRVALLSPLLDTLGISIRTPELTFTAGESHDLDLPIPSAQRVANAFCTAAWRTRGPAAMIGFVRDPDTKNPAMGSKVSLVYDDIDLIGRKKPVTRESPVDSSGFYRICGLPGNLTGTVQVFRNGVSSGEVPVEITNGFLALRAFSVAKTQTVVEVKADSGKVKRFATGSAKVTGKVVNKNGQPLRDARVMLQGGGNVALTKANGTFELDSLPSGTQALEIRKLGYSVTQVAVELSANTMASASTVTMSDAVPLLATMRVEAKEDQALSDLGYLQRKKTGMGFYMDGNQINHESLAFSDVMRAAPGLLIQPTGDGRTYQISDARNPANGCVNFYVDGTLWQQMTPGDIDDYVRPADLVAVEVYHGSETPPQYQPPGQSGCATIVAWTQAKTETMIHKKKSNPNP